MMTVPNFSEISLSINSWRNHQRRNIWISYFINSRTDYLVRWIIDHDVTVLYHHK